ncbi:MAG: hypothetical protein CBC23_007490 [Rhodospirillaceae bacterium TMED63]|nr:hypothetical protein [Rhodospirillaceae bacterium]RPF99180.1 MAG: hypothetical protein CBC23_007490 [Rhodospirillaceae bacterium TMED63]
MNENKNPLTTPPKAQRFQLIVVVYVMWTTIVYLGMGSWRRWRELVVVHVGVAVGVLITDLTFEQAGSQGGSRLSNTELGFPENHPQKITDGDGELR